MGSARFALPAGLCGVAAGILAADALDDLPVAALIALGAALLTLARAARVPVSVVVVGVALVAAGAGAWRGEAAGSTVGGPQSVASLAGGGEYDVAGTVIDDPRPRGDRLQLVLGELLAAGHAAAPPLSDRLLVWLPRGIDAANGDRLRIRSQVELAEDFDGFAYREYLARQGIGAIARARSAEVMAGEGGPSQALASLRNLLLGGLNDLVPEPEAALGAGILLGVRASIAPEINDAFATAGLTHVVAISGWNIAIVAALVAAAISPLARRPGGRWTTAAVAAVTVGGYVLLTGA
ncbi:MAG TPA: ComEC/Rec2 family competence protein, partial [Candidatus Limnocylindria bacterium]